MSWDKKTQRAGPGIEIKFLKCTGPDQQLNGPDWAE